MEAQDHVSITPLTSCHQTTVRRPVKNSKLALLQSPFSVVILKKATGRNYLNSLVFKLPENFKGWNRLGRSTFEGKRGILYELRRYMAGVIASLCQEAAGRCWRVRATSQLWEAELYRSWLLPLGFRKQTANILWWDYMNIKSSYFPFYFFIFFNRFLNSLKTHFLHELPEVGPRKRKYSLWSALRSSVL